MYTIHSIKTKYNNTISQFCKVACRIFGYVKVSKTNMVAKVSIYGLDIMSGASVDCCTHLMVQMLTATLKSAIF